MKNFNWKAILPHLIAVAVFAIIAFLYCQPAFQGRVLQQEDTSQWKAMAQSSFVFKDKYGHMPLWTNSMFCGMPAYLFALGYENPLGHEILMHAINLWLPEPANFFFLACICFYFLAIVLRCNPYIGIITALAYAYCTYNPVIIVAGHLTKMTSIAVMPALIASVTLLFNKKYILGTACTAFFTMLFVAAGHLQINYYGLIILVFMGVNFAYWAFVKKEVKHLLIAGCLAMAAAAIGAGVNMVVLKTSNEYTKYSIRGGSALADEKQKGNVTKTGLSTDYAFSYSLYKTEPIVMMVPHAYGGSGLLEMKEEDSKAANKIAEVRPVLQDNLNKLGQPQLTQNIMQQLYAIGAYWGGIGGTAGPPYIGAIICLLAFMGFAVTDNKYRWWVLATIVLTLMLSWGQYFLGFNTWMLNHLPFYNKFRAPSMILVVPTFLMCMMAALGLQKIVTAKKDDAALFKKFLLGLYITSGMIVLAFLIYLSGDYTTEVNKNLLKQVSEINNEVITDSVKSVINALKQDRKGLFMGDLMRTIFIMALGAGLLWLCIKQKLKPIIVIPALGLIALIDVLLVNATYFNESKYINADDYVADNFKLTNVDKQLQQDTTHWRVFNLSEGVFGAFNSDAKTSYYHNSIGGYNPAKLSIYQDLMEKQLYNFPRSMNVVNMLNGKYIMQQNQQTGEKMVQVNPDALGNCWFIKGITYKKGPKEIMDALTNLNTKDSAVIDEVDKGLCKFDNTTDSTDYIKLISNRNDDIDYACKNSTAKFAVFSEIFYEAGWKAYIDEKETPIVRTNYVLRGLSIPAGTHKIRFQFHPDSYYTSVKISIACSGLIWVLILGALGFYILKAVRAKKDSISVK